MKDDRLSGLCDIRMMHRGVSSMKISGNLTEMPIILKEKTYNQPRLF